MDDPASVADALDQWAEADEANARNYSFVSTASTLNERAPDLRTAARLLRDHADTTNRLADHKASLAIQAFTAPDEDEAVMMESLVARIGDAIARADAAEARLSALTDAIGDPNTAVDRLHTIADFYEMIAPLLDDLGQRAAFKLNAMWLRRIAAAVQPPDSTVRAQGMGGRGFGKAEASPDSTPPPADRCPDCGSDDPRFGRSGGKAVRVHACRSDFHTPPPSVCDKCKGDGHCAGWTTGCECTCTHGLPTPRCPACRSWDNCQTCQANCSDPWHQR